MFHAHAKELEPEFEELVSPDWEAYLGLEERGQLLALGAWARVPGFHAPAGERLVGYAVGVVLPSAHYRDVITLHHDLLFVEEKSRKGGLGARLMSALKILARGRGARRILMHAKPGTVFERLLLRLGFSIEEVIYSKEVD